MGRGSAGNVIAALCSFFIPGLGQLLQGRWILAGFMFVMSVLLWVILLGWVIHLWSIIDAALIRRRPATVLTGTAEDTTGKYSFKFKRARLRGNRLTTCWST